MRWFFRGLICIVALVMMSGHALADERIYDWYSTIVVNADSTLTVTETLRVHAGGVKIKRGIYREFPTIYKGRGGMEYVTGFEVMEVLLDGRPEDYSIKRMDNGKRLYVGDKDRYLPKGDYTYTIKYRTDRQLGFYDDHDELYWNVNGNGWVFPIDRMRATVVLPKGAVVQKYKGYTGKEGSAGVDYRVEYDDAGHIVFSTTRGLAAHDGLTIAVGWPKGYVSKPTAMMRFWYFLRDVKILLISFGAFAAVFVYYLMAWDKVGRDPEGGSIMPRYFPPKGFSPASVRYVMKMGYDNKAFTASVINLAVKGYLSIEEKEKGEYVLLCKKERVARGELSGGEKVVFETLFGTSGSRLGSVVELKQGNHALIKSAMDTLSVFLKREYRVKYFKLNTSHLWPGIGMTLAALAVLFFALDVSPYVAGMMIHVMIWPPVFVFFASKVVIPKWKAFFSTWKFRHLFAGLLFTPHFLMLAAACVILPVMIFKSNWGFGLALTMLSITNIVFYYLLAAPTQLGRKAMDYIEGFAMFMSATQRDRLNMLNAPDRTPEVFEKYLPYALALDVEQQWSEQFSDVLANASAGASTGSGGYYWYHSHHGGIDHSTFASSLSDSFSTAISSSSRAPGSSGGGGGFSGGGGSSGGGGGGGGGGGW